MPGWEQCLRRASMFNGVDPPRALTAAQSMAPPDTTPAADPTVTGAMADVTPPPAPAQPIPDSQPSQTQSPNSPNTDPGTPFGTPEPAPAVLQTHAPALVPSDNPPPNQAPQTKSQASELVPSMGNDPILGNDQSSQTPDAVAKILTNFGNEPVVQPGPSTEGSPNILPEQASQIHSILDTNSQGQPASIAIPPQGSPSEAAQGNPGTGSNSQSPGSQNSNTENSNQGSPNSENPSSPNQGSTNVGPDQISQIHSILGQSWNSNPSPAIGASGSSPDPVAQINSIIIPSPQGSPAPSSAPYNLSPDQVAQINSVLNANSNLPASNDAGIGSSGFTNQPGSPNQVPSNGAPSPVLVGGQSIVKGTNGAIIIGSSTIASGSQGTVAGHVISAGSSSVAVDGSSYPLPPSEGSTVQTVPQQQSAPVLVGGQSIVRGAYGAVIIGGSTIAPGSQSTIKGHIISAGPSNVVVDGSIYARPTNVGGVVEAAAQPTAAPVLVGNQPIVKASNGGVIVAGSTTIGPGTQATVQGHVISAGSSNVNVDGANYALPTSQGGTVQAVAPPSPVLFDGQSMVKATGEGIVVGGSATITPGEHTTMQGHAISVGSSGLVVDGSSSYAMPTSAGGVVQTASQANPSTPVLIAGQSMVKAADGGVMIGGTRVAPGAQITDQGHVISVGPTNVVMDGSNSYAVPTNVGGVVEGASSLLTSTPVLVDGQPLVEGANGGLIIGSTTLTPGAQITDQGHLVSVGSSDVVVDGSIYQLPTNAGEVIEATLPQQTNSPVLINGQPLVEATSGGLIVGSTTLTPGAQVTVGGHTISKGISDVIVDGSTYPLPTHAGELVQQITSPQQGALILINGQPLVKASNGELILDGTTLPSSTQIMTEGHTIYEGASSVVVDGSTYAVPTSAGGVVRAGFYQGGGANYPAIDRPGMDAMTTAAPASTTPGAVPTALPETAAGGDGNAGASATTAGHKSEASSSAARLLGWQWVTFAVMMIVNRAGFR